MSEAAIAEMASVLAVCFAGGRRAGAVLDAGQGRSFQTDLRTVVVPVPVPGDNRLETLACGVALQASPSKEAAVHLEWWARPRRDRRALAWAEGEAAVRWTKAAWPGLGRALSQRFPWVQAGTAATTPDELAAEAARWADQPLPAVPELFGRLPAPPRRAALEQRRTRVASSWVMRRRARRGPLANIPVSGRHGEDAMLPGSSAPLEALDGRNRRLFGCSYDEWDVRRSAYRPDHVRVVELFTAVEGVPSPQLSLPPLMTARHLARREEDGELDIDSVVDWRCRLAEGLSPADTRLFTALRRSPRPVVWSLLVDASASAAAGRGRVFSSSLAGADATANTLAQQHHPVAVFAFHGFTHERVELRVLKWFEAPYRPFAGAPQLRPDGYTRLGAALRHVGRRLLEQPGLAHVLLSFGDGRVSDEGYDGAYGRADVARAVAELRAQGSVVFHLAVGPAVAIEMSEMFGAGGWARMETINDIIPHLRSFCDGITAAR